jgi:hypothetical protein
MTDRERVERFQRLLRTACQQMATKRFEGPLDAYFWTTLRECFARLRLTLGTHDARIFSSVPKTGDCPTHEADVRRRRKPGRNEWPDDTGFWDACEGQAGDCVINRDDARSRGPLNGVVVQWGRRRWWCVV